MDLNEFYYDLDESFIAQTPLKHRSASKLLVLNKSTGEIKHDEFGSIVNFLNEGDCLILNDSGVFKARIFGTNKKTQAKVEFLLLKQEEPNVWQALCKPAKRVRCGSWFSFKEGLCCAVVKELEDGLRLLKFEGFAGDFFSLLNKIGEIPLPPYIKTKAELVDPSRYQTIYSKDLGSVAAPTAGLHFTTEILDKLRQKGVRIGFVTLHVGLGTFRPVKVSKVENHKMHSESFVLLQNVADLINETKQKGKRVVCVGTTSCRTIESVLLKKHKICACSGSTDLFIYPGFKFGVVDCLLTNFHLPCSTLLMLVSAFAGKDNIFKAYSEAKANDYRFFSFGDAMLIL